MDPQDRLKILKNLTFLEEKTRNFDEVFEKLVQKGMFSDYMKNEILANPNKVKFFYEYVTTRGPDAFKQLVDVMTITDNGRIATFLNDGKNRGCKVIQSGNSSNEIALDEEFPHNPNIIWRVRHGIERYDLNREEVYKIGSKPKGLVLIINIRKFVNGTKEERLGSEHDVKRLRETFEQVGYKVFVKEDDLKAEEILEAVKTFSQNEEHWKCDSCIVIMMSHGTFPPGTTQSVNFHGWDTKLVNSEDIIRQFHGHRCQALVGKPKIFFFQACRGDQYNFTVAKINENERELVNKIPNNDKENEDVQYKFSNMTINSLSEVRKKHESEPTVEIICTQTHPLTENCTDNHQTTESSNEHQLTNGNGCGNQLMNGNNSGNQLINGNSSGNQLMTDSGLIKGPLSVDPFPTGDRIRVDADIFIGYSTTPGNVSRRDPDTGSWFIQILCQMIAKHSWNKDISTILEHTDREIRKKIDCGTVQSIEVVNILTKKFNFQPGIYDD